MRLVLLTGAVLGSAGLAACGGDGKPPGAPPEPVRLEISAPSDSAIASGGAIEVRGRVSPPRARVLVLGRVAQVSGGSFTALVPLDPGPNVIDVAASARGRTAAFAALRITREDRVAVPALRGVASDEAERSLRALGFRVESSRGGGLIDHILPGEVAVCDQEPAAGAEVRRGSTVRILVARSC